MQIFTGREYHPFSFYNTEDVDRMIILMGSATDAAREAIGYLNSQGQKVGMIATTYGYVYVAQIAMSADHVQCLKAIREAEAWHGPSIIISYAPCINHGLKAKGGVGKSQAEEKKAVICPKS